MTVGFLCGFVAVDDRSSVVAPTATDGFGVSNVQLGDDLHQRGLLLSEQLCVLRGVQPRQRFDLPGGQDAGDSGECDRVVLTQHATAAHERVGVAA